MGAAKLRLGIVLWLVLLPAAGWGGRAAPPNGGWKPLEKFDFQHRSLTRAELAPLSLRDLKYLRGIVFGRHGRVFGEEAIQDFLRTRSWYKPDPQYRVSSLSPMERHNMDLIKEAEWRKHAHVEPGDLRFYRDRVLSAHVLGPHSLLEWRIMAAEIEAWHGKRFDDQPWLQQFFEERYWYHPDAHYAPQTLNPRERKNLALIASLEKRQRGLMLAPGDMVLFTESPVAPEMLRGLGLYELRLLRNEVYARRGYRFHTGWLAAYFAGQSWYRPRPAAAGPVTLSGIDRENVTLVAAAEARLHQDLIDHPLRRAVLQGLSGDDARKLRNEIYARHGKIFHDSWLQSYFRSLPWYRPDRGFSETSLRPVERANAALILAYENGAHRQLQHVAA